MSDHIQRALLLGAQRRELAVPRASRGAPRSTSHSSSSPAPVWPETASARVRQLGALARQVAQRGAQIAERERARGQRRRRRPC